MVSMSTFKVRLDEGMSDVSSDAISAVYPEYYSEVYPEMTALQMRIAGFRAKEGRPQIHVGRSRRLLRIRRTVGRVDNSSPAKSK